MTNLHFGQFEEFLFLLFVKGTFSRAAVEGSAVSLDL
jgi:hypothetical protein